MSGPTELEGATELEHLSTEEIESTDVDRNYYLQGLGFLALLVAVTGMSGFVYMLMHNVYAFHLLTQPGETWSFGFVGGVRNPASIIIEVFIWSLVGVNSALAYSSGRDIIRKRFRFLRYLTLWISTVVFAQGVAVAVILSLQVISLNIGGIEITLANASIETIIAISFILGFYHNDARRLLGSLRGRIVTGMEETLEEETPELEEERELPRKENQE
jgi:hypothetical protein